MSPLPPLERRPAGAFALPALPTEWLERFGRPPHEQRTLEEWLRHAIEELPTPSEERIVPDVAEVEGRYFEERAAATSAAPPSTAALRGSHIVGLGIPFNAPAELPAFRERFEARAFDDDRRRSGWRDIFSAWMHDPVLYLGSTRAGSFRLTVKPRGVEYKLAVPNTTLGRDVAELVASGDVAGASPSFRTLADEWSIASDGRPLRTIRQARLKELSLVHIPAYATTTARLAGAGEQRGASVRVLELELEARRRRLANGMPLHVVENRIAKRERLHATRPRS